MSNVEGFEKAGDEQVDAELLPIAIAGRQRMAARPPAGSVSIAEIRARACAEFAEWNAEPTPIARVTDLTASAGDRQIALRLYDPTPGEDSSLLVYLHGGGWMVGDLDFEDAAARWLAAHSGGRILSVDYRLIPEHPFPAAIDDAVAVIRWLTNGEGPPVAPDRIGLGGASAGANLALGAALTLRDAGSPMPRFLLLMYGAYLGGAPTPSQRQFGDGRFGLPTTIMSLFWRNYAGGEPRDAHPYIVPAGHDLRGLPPAFINYAGLDILRDDSIELARQLGDCGVPVELRGYPAAIHGFTQYSKASRLARQALTEAGVAIRTALASGR